MTTNGHRLNGSIKFWNTAKGYGFLERDDGERDVFVHLTELRRAGKPEPREGDRFSFEVTVNKRNNKLQAVSLQSRY